MPEFEALRDQARDIKNHTLANLDFYLEAYEKKVIETGGHVHWAPDAKAAREKVLEICRKANARTVTKSKSMIAEEIALNDFLEANNIEPIETDLGEYIIQLRKEPPSHIIAPAVHLTKDQVAETFAIHHKKYGFNQKLVERNDMVQEARYVLRAKFLLGLFEQPFADAERAAQITNCAAHRALALRAAHQAIVLLKNDGNLLPLDRTGLPAPRASVPGDGARDVEGTRNWSRCPMVRPTPCGHAHRTRTEEVIGCRPS